MGVDCKAMILFRDGSEIQWFENAEFRIQEASEKGTGECTFQRKVVLQFGALLSNFFVRGIIRSSKFPILI
jgi:hypothetical protein